MKLLMLQKCDGLGCCVGWLLPWMLFFAELSALVYQGLEADLS